MISIYCDGAVLSNPGGPGGWGFVAEFDGGVIHRDHGALHGKSNNEAEYEAIIAALEWLKKNPIEGKSRINIHSDSELAINQIIGAYRCNELHLENLRRRCRDLAASIPAKVRFRWVPREENIEADIEAGRGLAEAMGVDEAVAREVMRAAGRRIHFLKMDREARKEMARFNATVGAAAKEYRKKSRIARKRERLYGDDGN